MLIFFQFSNRFWKVFCSTFVSILTGPAPDSSQTWYDHLRNVGCMILLMKKDAY